MEVVGWLENITFAAEESKTNFICSVLNSFFFLSIIPDGLSGEEGVLEENTPWREGVRAAASG